MLNRVIKFFLVKITILKANVLQYTWKYFKIENSKYKNLSEGKNKYGDFFHTKHGNMDCLLWTTPTFWIFCSLTQ